MNAIADDTHRLFETPVTHIDDGVQRYNLICAHMLGGEFL